MSKSSTRVIYPSLSKSYNLKAPVKQMYTYCQILHISWPMLKVIRFFQLWYNTVQPVPLNTFLLKAHDWPILLEIAICCFLSFFLFFFFFGDTLASNNIMSGFIFVTVQSVMSLPCWSSIGQELLSDLSIYIYIYINCLVCEWTVKNEWQCCQMLVYHQRHTFTEDTTNN